VLPSTGERGAALDAGAPAQETRRLPFEFHASGGEYFRIWIVNLLLTIATLGIYSAWAKVRRLRYFYGSTRLDDLAFDYHGRPIQILKGRLIAFGAYAVFYVFLQVRPLIALGLLPLFVFGVPWIIMKSRRFQLRMTSWRGLRFGFTGTYGGALGAYVGWPLLGAVTLGLLWPRSIYEQARYQLAHARFGSAQARFTTPPRAFFAFAFATLLGFVALYAAAVGLVTMMIAGSEGREDFPLGTLSPLHGGLLIAALGVGGVLLNAYYRKCFLNAAFGGLVLGPHRVESTLETWPLFRILAGNFVLIVATLGLYSPWAKVRQARYQLENLKVVAQGDLDRFVAEAGEGTDAIGEELGDFFDLDFGF